MLTAEQKKLRDEVRVFVKDVPRQFILDMDADRVRYPREYVEGAVVAPGAGVAAGPQAAGRNNAANRTANSRWLCRFTAHFP